MSFSPTFNAINSGLGVSNPVPGPDTSADALAELQSVQDAANYGSFQNADVPVATMSANFNTNLDQSPEVSQETNVTNSTATTPEYSTVNYEGHEMTREQLVQNIEQNFYKVVHNFIDEHPEMAKGMTHKQIAHQIAEQVADQAVNQGYGADGEIEYKELLSASVDIWEKMKANPDQLPQADPPIENSLAANAGLPTSGEFKFRTSEFDFAQESHADFGNFEERTLDFSKQEDVQVVLDDIKSYMEYQHEEQYKRMTEAQKDAFAEGVFAQAFERQRDYGRDGTVTDIELEAIVDRNMQNGATMVAQVRPGQGQEGPAQNATVATMTAAARPAAGTDPEPGTAVTTGRTMRVGSAPDVEQGVM